MVLVPLAPWAMDKLLGDAESEKSGVAAGVRVYEWEPLELLVPPVTYNVTLPTFVAGGVQRNVQDVVSTAEKAY